MSVSMLLCPLCGKSSSLDRYDPTGFEDDIFVQTLRGLGRGKGFKVTSTQSIFDLDRTTRIESTINRLCGRSLEIVGMMLENGVLTEEDLVDRLGLTPTERSDLAADVVRFLDSIEELLYDQADEDSQQAAMELKRKAESQT
jgi:hypothetical protein